LNTPIVFGTDGWRAIIADDYTFDNVRRCAYGVVRLMQLKGLDGQGVVIGYDKRFESEDFAAAAAEVVSGAGVKAYLCDRSEPTPTISHAVLANHAGAGITITASHNPATYNGFKVRSDYGGAASPETIAELEGIIAGISAESVPRMARQEALKRGLLVDIQPSQAYVAQISQLVDLEAIRDSRQIIVVDAMYGAGMGWFTSLLGGKSIDVVEINAERNPWFGGINPEPITKNLEKLFDTVRAQHAGVGIATDGDADRLGLCDENGIFIDQLRVYSLLVLYLLEVRGFRGPIVKTISTSSMLNRLGEMYAVPVFETSVGFKYIAPKMIETNALVGGEESGGYAFRGHIPERDGILSGLFFLDMMVKMNKKPSELVAHLFEKVGPHHYDRLDVKFPATDRDAIVARLGGSDPAAIAGQKISQTMRGDGFKWIMADGSWLLIRFSGTEPIMRIYSEAGSPDQVRAILGEGRRLAGV
jgi:phosphomannomutase